MFFWLTADCCGIGGDVESVSCWMEEVVGKTASIDLVDRPPRVGKGVGGVSFSCSMGAIVRDDASIESLGGLPLGMGLNGAGGSCEMEAVVAGTVSIVLQSVDDDLCIVCFAWH